MPLGLEYLWQLFLELSGTREIGMGVGAIRPTEIEAHCRLMWIDLIPIEVSIIRRFDGEYLSEARKPSKP